MFILLFYLFSKFIPIIPVVRTGEEKDYSRLRKIVFEKQMKKVIKENKKSDVAATGIIILLMLISAPCIMAQDETGIKTVLRLEYFHIDSLQNLTATLQAKQEGRYLPLQGMEINFKFRQGATEKLIGTGKTNEKGKVFITIPEEVLSTSGDNGIYSFEAALDDFHGA